MKPQNGFLLSPGYNGPVLILKGRYYKQCESLRPKPILNHLLGDSLARMLIVKTYRAIKDIQTTPDRNASEKYSQPLLLNQLAKP